MTPKDDSEQQELHQQKERSILRRREFLVLGAGAIAGLTLPLRAQAEPVLNPLTIDRTQTNTGLKPTPGLTFVELPEATLGTSATPTKISVKAITKDLDTINSKLLSIEEKKTVVTGRYYSYNGETFTPSNSQLLKPGPTFKFKASDTSQNTLHLKLVNELPANEPTHYPSIPPYPTTGSPGTLDRPKGLNTTNLHFHGFHVSPSSQASGVSSDDVLVPIHPKGEKEKGGQESTGEHQYCVVLPKFHAPGTHWYHPHHHGSTAVQVVDGVAGALIVEEEGAAVIPVDKDLVWMAQEVISTKPLSQPDPKLPPVPSDQMIYNCSQISELFTINGVYQPNLTMKIGELHRWRFINATSTVRGYIQLQLIKCPSGVTPEQARKPSLLGKKQPMHAIAFDGISFYGKAPQVYKDLDLSPANRVDFLMQFQEAGTYQLVKKVVKNRGNLNALGEIQSKLMDKGPQKAQVLATIEVTSEQVSTPKSIPSTIPGTAPDYLQPIADSQLLQKQSGIPYLRPLVFNMFNETKTQNCNFYQSPYYRMGSKPREDQTYKDVKAGRLNPGQANPNPRLLQINGLAFTAQTLAKGNDEITYTPAFSKEKQHNPGTFEKGVERKETVQMVKLNTCEEWIIYNYTNVAHPFHIHVNPFQVVEVFDPMKPQEEKKTTYSVDDGIWWDTFSIPPSTFRIKPGATESTPYTVEMEEVGYIKVRMRFSNYHGKTVFHCHLLNHEDQGMMQIVEIVNDSSGTAPCVQLDPPSSSSGNGPVIGQSGSLAPSCYPYVASDFEPMHNGEEQYPIQASSTCNA